MTTTWNSADKSAGITLSNGNNTAAFSGATPKAVRSITSKTTGKWYYEVTVSTLSADTGVGLANAAWRLNFFAELGGVGQSDSIGFYPGYPPQSIYTQGNQLSIGTTFGASGNVVSVAVDLTNKRAWFSSTQMRAEGHHWNNNTTDNPATGTGGIDLSVLNSGAYFIAFCDDLGTAVGVLNTGGTAFNWAIPTGFSTWDTVATLPSPPPPAPSPQATASSVVVNLTQLGQSLPGTIWGMATSALLDTSNNASSGGFAIAAQTGFINAAAKLDLKLLRWNALASNSGNGDWEQFIFGNNPSAPDFTYMNNWFNNSAKFFNKSNRLICGMGPNSQDRNNDGTYWATAFTKMAQHFIAMGQECFWWEYGNEPNGNVDLTQYCTAFNQVAAALHAVNPAYKLGGPVSAGADGQWISTMAQRCGANVGFCTWHNYTLGPNGSDNGTAYRSAIGGSDAGGVRQALAGTAAANVPLFLGEYSTSYACNDPMMQNIGGAVFNALILQDGYDSDSNFTMGGNWEAVSDGQCGAIQNGNITPQGWYLGEAGTRMDGTRVAVTSAPAGNFKVTASVNGGNYAVQMINYDTGADKTVTVNFQNGPISTANVWTISPASPSGARQTNVALNATITIPHDSVVILYGTFGAGTPTPVPVPVPTPPAPPPVTPSGNPTLLPSGYLKTLGNQIIDAISGTPVRIACIEWDNIGVGPIQGIADNVALMLEAGFNCIRLPWYNRSLAVNLATYDPIVSAASSQGMKIIFDNRANEGFGNCATQQANGLWYDVGGVSGNTDGCGTAGTVTDAQFIADWATWAAHYRGNPTVIGYDIRHEPKSLANMCTWEASSNNPNQNLRWMYERAANAILAIDPNVLIICEGPQNPASNFASTGVAPWGDLSAVGGLPVNPSVPHKIVYAIHDYPNEISGITPDNGNTKIASMNSAWGYLVTQNIAPVWVGGMGSSMNATTDAAWASTMVQYINGQAGTLGGPTFISGQQPISTNWYSWGNLGTALPDGTQNADGSLRMNQLAVYSQFFYRPSNAAPAPVSPVTVPAPTIFTAGPSIESFTIATVTATTANLTWNAPFGHVTNAVAHYTIQYRLAGDFVWTTLAPFASTLATSVAFSVSNLAPHTVYYFRANANGSRFCFQAQGTTSGGGSDSPDCDFIADANTAPSDVIIGKDGTTYSLAETTTLPFQVKVNGVNDTDTSEAIQLYYRGGKVYHQNKDYLWFGKTLVTDSWTLLPDPRVGAPPIGNDPPTFDIRSDPTTVAPVVMSPHGNPSIIAPTITFIYWGSYWNTATGPSSGDITGALQTNFSGPYFTGLQEYGVFAKPVVARSLIYTASSPPDFSTLTVDASTTVLHAIIVTMLDANFIPAPVDDNQFYMLILPPAANNTSGVSAAHDWLTYHGSQINFGWSFHFAASAGISILDWRTGAVTHEIVEAITDSNSGFNGPGDGSTPTVLVPMEMEDVAETGEYLNGVWVHSFWSNKQRAMIIPTTAAEFPVLPSPPAPGLPPIPTPTPTPVPIPVVSVNSNLFVAFWEAMTDELVSNKDILFGFTIDNGDPQGATGLPDNGVTGTNSMTVIKAAFKSIAP